MGKDRFAPHTRRFASVPRQPALYVAELTKGDETLVKVGACGNALGRLMSLQNEVKRDHGAKLGHFIVVPKPTAKAAYEAETRLIGLLNAVASPIDGRREFFAGISFNAASLLAEQITQPAQCGAVGADPVSTEAVRHGPDGLSLACR